MSKTAWISGAELAAGRPYAERSENEAGWHDRLANFLVGATIEPLWGWVRDPARELRWIVDEVERRQRAMRIATDVELGDLSRDMRIRLRRQGFTPALVGACYTLVQEAAARVIGQRHYHPQLMGGLALLQGKLVEMGTGEGKTMTATLPASIVALAGYPVHIITVNDYLAQRDAEEMGPVYRFLGLTVGSVAQGMPAAARREAYARSVTYCSNKELAFDYLRDRIALAQQNSRLHLSLQKMRGSARGDEPLVLRGLYYGIVDEADSVFIDEARTPLILSSQGAVDQREDCEAALELAAGLSPVDDYTTNHGEREITLTRAGRGRLAELSAGLTGVWTSPRAREELITQALSAIILFRRDHHYIVAGGKVQIVDESTGRVMPDRSWERGLHQLIEVKEGCEPTNRHETLARMTYQRLFRRYLRLAGMSGTAKEVAREIKQVYKLDVVRIPLHKPSRRKDLPNRVHLTRAAKCRAIGDTVERLAASGCRPVLIGTRSVRASEEISSELTKRSLDHALLNAKQDKEEAAIVARAGEPTRVTVATNMAGRGTDIRLGPGVAEQGGLHVILTEYHESRRIDRQFFGRCARQGDPGSCEAIVSLEDEIYALFARLPTGLVRRILQRYGSVPTVVYGSLRRFAQSRAERRAAQVRVQNLRLDRRLDRILAFSGRGE
jgi:preprotein translocase subunit SecA